MLGGLRTTIYKVSDLELAKNWYSQVLRTEPYFDEPFYVGYNVAGYELGLKPVDGDSPRSDSVIAYWSVGDAATEFERILQIGAEKHTEPWDVGGGVFVAAVYDPFGNVFGIIENRHFKTE